MSGYAAVLRRTKPWQLAGSVSQIIGLMATVADFPAPLGASCRILSRQGATITGEVVGFREQQTLVLPYGELSGVAPGDAVQLHRSCRTVAVGRELLGRVLDGLGRPIDGRGSLACENRAFVDDPPVAALDRPPIDEPLSTGVRAIDAFLTCGRGQRVGIFAGSGVGKSTLLGQIARQSSAALNVVVLVGERGREVREFLERDLGSDGLAKSVVVVATGDESPLLRLRAALTGTAIAEYFRDAGEDVLLVMDSVTRFALAQREIGLAMGEPPATRGYPPSVFSLLPRLLERSGRTSHGSITALYTVLVEGDDTNEPIADTVRGVLDGHVVLSRRLAERAHWPAIDLPASLSRVMPSVTGVDHRRHADAIRRLMAAHRDAEELITLGAYQSGADATIDQAIRLKDSINGLVCQNPAEETPFQETVQQLARLAGLTQPASASGPGTG